MSEQEALLSVLQNDFPIEVSSIISKEEILNQLEVLVSAYLTQQPERFFQLMYRLDIAEPKLKEALADPTEGVRKVANLIYTRQLEKIRSRANFRDNNIIDNDLQW